MKIVRSDEFGHWTIMATDDNERHVLSAVIAEAKVGDKLEYYGRSDDSDGRLSHLHFNAGGKREPKTTRLGRSTVTRSEPVGGVNFDLYGTTEEDRKELGAMRDTCFFGSSGLIMVRASSTGLGIVVTAALCKLCQSPMIKMGRCEWKTCDACLAKCDHKWKRGAVHGGGIEIGVGEFCALCGTGKPKDDQEPELSPLEQALAYQEFDPYTTVFVDNVPVSKVAEVMGQAGIPI